MASSYLNIVTFLLTTLFYYMILKPSLTYDTMNNAEDYKSYMSSNYMCLAIYLLLVMMIQFIVNASTIASTCGGSISENMGTAGVFTFIPWILIFGIIIIVLVLYPGFKSAFSDVIGYYYVSSKANTYLVDLLADQDLEKVLNDGPQPLAVVPNDNRETSVGGKKGQKGGTKEQIQKAADLIIKICGNTSILINQMSPTSFKSMWSILTPLKKEKYKNDNSPETKELRDKIFELVVTRDNIGEGLWYIYTGLLLTSIVQLKITSAGCASNPKTMEQNYKKFQEQEDAAQQKTASATNTTYTITN
jgi:hypothetical protein